MKTICRIEQCGYSDSGTGVSAFFCNGLLGFFEPIPKIPAEPDAGPDGNGYGRAIYFPPRGDVKRQNAGSYREQQRDEWTPVEAALWWI